MKFVQIIDYEIWVVYEYFEGVFFKAFATYLNVKHKKFKITDRLKWFITYAREVVLTFKIIYRFKYVKYLDRK